MAHTGPSAASYPAIDSALRHPETLAPSNRPASGGRVSAIVAWGALVVLVVAVVCLQFFGRDAKESRDALPADPGPISSMQLKLLTRYMGGVKSLEAMVGGGQVPLQAESAIDGYSASTIDRVRAVVAAGELIGPDAALKRLDALTADLDELTLKGVAPPQTIDGYRRDEADLRRIYTSGPAALAPADRDSLVARHGWFGSTALAFGLPDTSPERQALASESLRVLVAVLVGVGLAGLGLLAGIVLFVIACAGMAAGRIRPRYPRAQLGEGGRPAPFNSAFVEVMALFLAGFLVTSVAAGLIARAGGPHLTHLFVWPLLLVALWPLARGVSGRELRMGLGWHTNGRGVAGFFREVGAGLLGYLAGLPVVGLGLLVTISLMWLLGSDAAHPIGGELEKAGLPAAISLLALATLWAPIVEETMFRGALYHGVRRWAHPLVAALIVAFVFAAIHPQGLAGIPVLMSLAVIFALIREWRGSIVGPMAAHALNNAFIVTLLLVAVA
ncbi:MAG: CPBP family intramembrane metalloprotease [Phycisphaerales bacterium]|nr:CPBP family intramembrane metalloprotease [Phycisphaerales bacterium]